ncbi:hypothetical protein I302_101694 [Kwoniella bestiolae CBS 10118]|uniref:SWR1-complex protein 5 n=1 Tax=Kwoniella bestiolae CBS 10118 TaxID=1296100 RepID=A0A1B9GCZ2_9TREE|nr:hypothetical protein I302_00370 [Kwoniella bestiolae CBS 10118]OCF28880.1 hypothetical protein I302_00370 [Kwoniella bestiolae CBS 10118]
MSTLATADLSSDSENDGDYIPTSPKRKTKSQGSKRAKRVKLEGSESDEDTSCASSSDGDNEDQEEAKDVKVDEIQERKRKAREEFERIRAELSAPVDEKREEARVEMVEVQRARRFAGETIYEIVKLRKDDPEAIAFLAEQSFENQQNGRKTDIPELTDEVSLSKETQISSSASIPNQQLPSTSADPTPPPRPKGPPIRRKPRQSLEAMSAALDRGKKMTTLEKSQMDWKSHTTSTTGLSDELALNRKNGGGYLDKRDFLDRVGERRSNTFDGNNSTRK